jgi:predicted  nucleic acid-binding Zn-ribbon protein
MNLEALLELQLADTAIDQLKYRLGHLPEVMASAEAAAAYAQWTKRATSLRQQIIDLEASIAATEKQSAVLSDKRERLEKQLKTVISPREAEALMHEIETLTAQRSVLDDAELVAMEAVAADEAELDSHSEGHDDLQRAAASASDVADQALAAAKAELEQRRAARDVLRSGIDDAVLARYDSMRAQFGGVGVAKLNGLRCEGCHLDLSRGEVDALKRDEGGEVPECPNCGRLLVR